MAPEYTCGGVVMSYVIGLSAIVWLVYKGIKDVTQRRRCFLMALALSGRVTDIWMTGVWVVPQPAHVRLNSEAKHETIPNGTHRVWLTAGYSDLRAITREQ